MIRIRNAANIIPSSLLIINLGREPDRGPKHPDPAGEEEERGQEGRALQVRPLAGGLKGREVETF